MKRLGRCRQCGSIILGRKFHACIKEIKSGPQMIGKMIDSIENWLGNKIIHFNDGTSVLFEAEIDESVSMLFYKDNTLEDPKVKWSKKWMNKPHWCNYCRRTTPTKEWDCIYCNFSKGHPEII